MEQGQVVALRSQRSENAKSTLEQIQNQLRYEIEPLKQPEEPREHPENEANQKQLDDRIAQLKSRMDTSNGQEWQSKQMECETELRAERQKLERLEGALDQLSKGLGAAVPAEPNGQDERLQGLTGGADEITQDGDVRTVGTDAAGIHRQT